MNKFKTRLMESWKEMTNGVTVILTLEQKGRNITLLLLLHVPEYNLRIDVRGHVC